MALIALAGLTRIHFWVKVEHFATGRVEVGIAPGEACAPGTGVADESAFLNNGINLHAQVPP